MKRDYGKTVVNKTSDGTVTLGGGVTPEMRSKVGDKTADAMENAIRSGRKMNESAMRAVMADSLDKNIANAIVRTASKTAGTKGMKVSLDATKPGTEITMHGADGKRGFKGTIEDMRKIAKTTNLVKNSKPGKISVQNPALGKSSSKMISFKDIKVAELPSAVQKAIKDILGSTRPKVELRFNSQANAGGASNDNSKPYVILHNIKTGETRIKAGSYYESLINAGPEARKVSMGYTEELTPDTLVINVETGSKYVSVYAHPQTTSALSKHNIASDSIGKSGSKIESSKVGDMQKFLKATKAGKSGDATNQDRSVLANSYAKKIKDDMPDQETLGYRVNNYADTLNTFGGMSINKIQKHLDQDMARKPSSPILKASLDGRMDALRDLLAAKKEANVAKKEASLGKSGSKMSMFGRDIEGMTSDSDADESYLRRLEEEPPLPVDQDPRYKETVGLPGMTPAAAKEYVARLGDGEKVDWKKAVYAQAMSYGVKRAAKFVDGLLGMKRMTQAQYDEFKRENEGLWNKGAKK